MPRSLAGEIAALGFRALDARDIGLRGSPDSKVFEAAIAADAVIITRDRGFAKPKDWPTDFTAGVVFVNLPDSAPARTINARVTDLLAKRLPESLLGALTTVETNRALSRTHRRRE